MTEFRISEPLGPAPAQGNEPTQGNEMYVDAFARGLQVIRSFNDGPEKLTLSDVARRTGISRASTRRLLHTLLQLRYVDYDGKYFSLRPSILNLGYSYISSLDLSQLAKPAMDEVATAMNSSCSLSVLDGYDVIYLRRTEVRQVSTCRSTVGSRVPAHLLSMGRIQLAALSDAALDDYFENVPLERLTPYTVTDPGQLRNVIRADGEKGWSIIRRERDEGICSIGMSIRDKDGKVVAGIGLGIRPDLSNDPETIENTRRELAKAVASVGDLLRMRS
jgi:IclR family pca regulon transcriptional regulator